MKKYTRYWCLMRLMVLLWGLVGIAAAATQETSEGSTSEHPLRETMARYLGPPQRFSVLIETGTSADFWNVVFEEDGPTNATTAEVARDPYLLVVGGVTLFNIFGYIDWNLTYRTDNVAGALDLRAADSETGPGRGNTELNSTLQIPLGYVGLGLGYLGVPEENVYWLNFLRFQIAPTERLFRWETTLKSTAAWIDLDGTVQVAEDNRLLFPARYSERRYSLVGGLWPLLDEWSGDPTASIIAGGTLEMGVMTMAMSSPMQFRLRAADGDILSGSITRQFLTRNEANGFYTRATLGDRAAALDMDPEALSIEIWADFFSGQTTLTTGVFELSTQSASPVSEFNSGRLVARRFGFGGGVSKQSPFGRRGNGRFRWGVSAYWHTYNYGPAAFGSISSAFNEWETELTRDFQDWNAGDLVEVDFFRRESFWGTTAEVAIRF